MTPLARMLLRPLILDAILFGGVTVRSALAFTDSLAPPVELNVNGGRKAPARVGPHHRATAEEKERASKHRLCEFCGGPYVRGTNESVSHYLARRSCSRSCGGRR